MVQNEHAPFTCKDRIENRAAGVVDYLMKTVVNGYSGAPLVHRGAKLKKD